MVDARSHFYTDVSTPGLKGAHPVRLQLSRARGFDLQTHSLATNGLSAVNVARPGPHGNPFKVGRDGDRAYCVELHAHLVEGRLALTRPAPIAEQQACRDALLSGWRYLAGKNLACWCRLDGGPCHADTLLRAVEVLEGNSHG